MPRVSVVMPVRDGARFLAEAIDSILTQSLSDFELIVIDDGSTDDSADIIARFAASEARVRPLTERGLGIAAALQTGTRAASAPLIARMDADDIALPDRLDAQVRYLTEHPGVVAVGGQVETIDLSGRSTGRSHYPIGAANCRSYLRRGSPFCHPAVMMRADALARCGGYRDRYGSAEDYDLWLRLAAEGDIDNLPRVVLRYRIHGENFTVRQTAENARDAALAYLAAFHALPATLTAETGGEGWEAVETALPADMKMTGRLAYLRMLALNGGITTPDATAFLLDSMGSLRREARRTGAEGELAFSLLRAARQFGRSRRYGLAARLAALACVTSPSEAARTTAAVLGRSAQGSP